MACFTCHLTVLHTQVAFHNGGRVKSSVYAHTITGISWFTIDNLFAARKHVITVNMLYQKYVQHKQIKALFA